MPLAASLSNEVWMGSLRVNDLSPRNIRAVSPDSDPFEIQSGTMTHWWVVRHNHGARW